MSQRIPEENPDYLKNLKYVFAQLRAYSPEGCIRFHKIDLIRQQLGIEGKGSFYSSAPFDFYYFPKKQDCKFNLAYFDYELRSAIPLGQVILQPVFQQSNSALGKKSSITCVKGKLIKKVTAIKPKCRTGYIVKK